MPGLVGLLTVVGMVVVAPLGLRRLGTPGVARLLPVWPFLGLLAGWSLLLRPGAVAVTLAAPYAAACLAVTALAAVRGLRWLRDRRTPLEREMVAAFAGVALTIASAGGLVPERSGVDSFLGFDRGTLGLTAAHFHFAGFAAVLIAGLTAQAAPTRAARAGAWSVPVGTALTFVGFFTSEYVELAGAVVLTAGLLLTSYALLRLHPGPLRTVAAVATPLTMALALWWAYGEAFGVGHLTLRQMAATHGIVNALGVGTCGLLGWHRAAPPAL
jgi:hypothetical protein